MQNCLVHVVPMFKREKKKFNSNHYRRNEIEKSKIKEIPYASVVGNLMYTQSYTLFNISFAIRMLEIFQSYPRWDD